MENNEIWYGDKVDIMDRAGGGNVWGYNYTDDAFEWVAPDLGKSGINGGHQTTERNELFEGNYSQNYAGDSYHGNSPLMTMLRNWFSGKRAGALLLSSFTSPNGGCTQYYGDYWGLSRAPVDVQGFQFYASFVGNVLGFKGQTLLSEPGGCHGPETAFVTQVTTANQYVTALNSNQVPMWEFGEYQASGGTLPASHYFDTTALTTATRLANWDWYTAAEHCYDFGAATEHTCGATNPAETNIPSSFYLTSKPAFFGTQSTTPTGEQVKWPWVDSTTGATYTLPAMYCFQHNKMPTCLQ